MDIRNLSTDDGGGVPVIAITAYVLDPEIIDADFQGIFDDVCRLLQRIDPLDSSLNLSGRTAILFIVQHGTHRG